MAASDRGTTGMRTVLARSCPTSEYQICDHAVRCCALRANMSTRRWTEARSISCIDAYLCYRHWSTVQANTAYLIAIYTLTSHTARDLKHEDIAATAKRNMHEPTSLLRGYVPKAGPGLMPPVAVHLSVSRLGARLLLVLWRTMSVSFHQVRC